MTEQTPRFPAVLRRPLAALPAPLKSAVLARALNVLFSRQLLDGDLDFLDGRVVNVSVPDADVRFSLTLTAGRIGISAQREPSDLQMRGDAYAFLQLASGVEDSDTLFFRRRIMTSGDTELGLRVKNFLEGVDPEALPFERMIGYTLAWGLRTADLLERLRRRLPGSGAPASS